MSWWEELVRGMAAVPTGGMSEVFGRDNQIGRTFSGGAEGGVGGFLTGGPIGAAMGAGTGMGLSGTGTTDPYSLKGGGINFGSGLGAGGLGSLGGSMMGGGGSMVPYAPTSAPNMGMAGSSLGGGMGSPLNLGPSAMGSTGAATGTPVAASAGPGTASQMLQAMRGMPSGGQQQAPASQQMNVLQKLYQMFPGLRPGSQMGQSMKMGGM